MNRSQINKMHMAKGLHQRGTSASHTVIHLFVRGEGSTGWSNTQTTRRKRRPVYRCKNRGRCTASSHHRKSVFGSISHKLFSRIGITKCGQLSGVGTCNVIPVHATAYSTIINPARETNGCSMSLVLGTLPVFARFAKKKATAAMTYRNRRAADLRSWEAPTLSVCTAK